MLWGRGGGTVVSVYSFLFYVLLFDDFFAIKSSYIKKKECKASSIKKNIYIHEVIQ